MIRPATVADARWFADQAELYLIESGDPLRFDWDHAYRSAQALLKSPDVIAFVDPGRAHLLATVVRSTYHPEDVLCRVSTVWVRPEHRGKGIGVRLIRAAEAAADVRGARPFLIDSNLRLIDAGEMYQRMGYAPVQVLYERQYGY